MSTEIVILCGVGSLLFAVVGIGLASWIIVRLPSDHFLKDSARPQHRHPALHVAFVIIRNLIGWPLILLGIVLLVAPGQGVLTILLGVSLADFPGKKRALHGILRSRPIRRTLNWIRRKAGRAPLQFPKQAVLNVERVTANWDS